MQNTNKTPPILAAVPQDCCGCSACAAICPVDAISMQQDAKGFPYPQIDESKCVRCGKCLAVCAFKKDAATADNALPLKIYAVRAKDAEVVGKSSSGGAFTAISDFVLQQGGAIASAVYGYSSHSMKYRLYDDVQTRDAARGSKYIHPILGDIYEQCVLWMKENPGKPLLFVGVGCHTAGFHQLLEARHLREQAILVDLICHGTPSPKLWADHIRFLEGKQNAPVEYVTFKDKRNGWKNPYAFARIAGNEVPLESYSYWFYESFSQRDACFCCPYTKLHRTADLTIGDFWGIEQALPDFYSGAGNSLVFIQTQKGADVFAGIQDAIFFAESTAQACLQPRLESPGDPNPRRDRFWSDYLSKGVPYLIKHYHEDGKTKVLIKKVIRKGKRILRKLIVPAK